MLLARRFERFLRHHKVASGSGFAAGGGSEPTTYNFGFFEAGLCFAFVFVFAVDLIVQKIIPATIAAAISQLIPLSPVAYMLSVSL
jgi:hypothetical protein